MLQYPIFYAGDPGSAFGWGICNRNLIRELEKLTRVERVSGSEKKPAGEVLPGHLFTPLKDEGLEPDTSLRGRFNHGYAFFEREPDERARDNAARLNTIFAGSTWCQRVLAEHRIESTVLIQGVDAEIFHPVNPETAGKLFVVFSGGKFEYRKGQDLVLRAMQEVQRRHDDIVLVNAWCNRWTVSLETMKLSPCISYELRGANWVEAMTHLYALNGIPAHRIVTLPLVSQEELAKAYRRSQLGLFPNRCEGGTNLVMMEYLACGKPVVASYTSGHTDILTDENAFLIRSLRPLSLKDDNGRLVALWEEAEIDEIVRNVEYAYLHRDEVRQKGARAAEDMMRFSWRRSAETVLKTLLRFEAKQKAPA